MSTHNMFSWIYEKNNISFLFPSYLADLEWLKCTVDSHYLEIQGTL